MPLKKIFLKDMIKKVNKLKDKNMNEENTRGILIEPILQALGWNIYDIGEILRNEKTSGGGFVDYILKADEKKIYIEAKPISSALNNKFQIQATKYAYEDNIPFCVLTNGNRYQIFETYKRGTISDKLLVDICLSDEEISINRKLEQLNFISKESVKSGNLEKINEILNLENEVNEIIQTLLSSPNHKFIELISSELNHKYNPDGIKEAIVKLGNEINFQESQIIDSAITMDPYTDFETEISFLINKLPKFKDILLSLRKKIQNLGIDVNVVYNLQNNHIVFKRDTEFTSIKVKPKNQELDVYLKFGEFEPYIDDLDKIEIEPLPKTYRYGRINHKMVITDEKQIDEAFQLIKQCYDLQLKWRK